MKIAIKTTVELVGDGAPDSLRRLPRSEQVALSSEAVTKFAQLMGQTGLSLDVVGESLQTVGSLAKGVAAGDKNWLGDDLKEMRRLEAREAVIQKEKAEHGGE